MTTSKSGIQVLETRPVDNSPPCKECRVNPRKQGSSRCNVCTGLYKAHQMNDMRLQNKIRAQLKK